MPEEKILIVDDDSAILGACVKAVQTLGYNVKGVNSGEEAIESLKTDEYQLVVTDLQMPGISGMELLSYIKQNHPNCDVIIITSYPSTDTAIEALRAGVYDYIKKPFNVNELRDKVKECLKIQQEKDKTSLDKDKQTDILTSYQVSKLCGITLTTVANWVEHGILPAYKTPGGHRRINKKDLVEFLKKYKMPIPEGLK